MAFVGREPELAQLAEAVRRVAAGHQGRVVMTGAVGIGSSRLIDELSTYISTVPGVVVSRGRAYEPSMGIPYQALGDGLAATLSSVSDERLIELVGPSAHDLSGVVPGLAERLDALGVDRSEPWLRAPDQLGRRVIESILGVLERLAARGVLLLVLEDIHFADPATRGFIDAVMSLGRSLSICLLLTYQPDEIHRRHSARPLIDRLARDRDMIRLEVGPLADAEIEQLVKAVAGERPDGAVMTAVREGARGNPLIATQLVSSAGASAGVRLSDPFGELTGARVDALDADANGIVRLLAVAHQPIDRATVRSASRALGRRATRSGLEAAVGSGLVTVDGDRLAIAHELHTEAIAARELTPERQALHAAIAGEFDGPAPARAAWHWARAARPSEARAAHLRAAEKAGSIDPGPTTLHHYEQALEMAADTDEDVDERAAALEGAARASAMDGSFRRAVALMRQAVDKRAARAPGRGGGRRDASERAVLGGMVAEQGRFEWASGDAEAAERSLRRALEIMPDGPSRLRADALASLAQQLMIDAHFKESADLAKEARAVAQAVVASDGRALTQLGHATCTLGVDVAYLGDLDGGLELLTQAEAASREAGRLDHLMRNSGNLTTLLDLDSRREEALAVVKASLDDAAEGGLTATYSALSQGNAADILFHLGRWAEAEQMCRDALEWSSLHVESTSVQALVTLGLLLAESRADDEASSVVGQALLQVGTHSAGQWTGPLLRASVSLALWGSDSNRALDIAETSWPSALEADDSGTIASAASTCLEAAAEAADAGRSSDDAGLIMRARTLARSVVPAATEKIAASELSPTLGARKEAELALATARAHAARVADESSPDAWADIAKGWTEASLPYLAAKASWWQALAYLGAAHDEAGRERARELAEAPLTTAYGLARDLGALPLMRAVVDLSARARVPMSLPGDAADVGEQAPIVAVGPGSPKRAVAVGPGPEGSKGRDKNGGTADIARAIEERVLAALNKDASDSYGLSPREREVLIIVAEGRTDRDIAARLFISERTVHVHVRKILSKLRVSSRTEAAGLALREGLVPLHATTPTASPHDADDLASSV